MMESGTENLFKAVSNFLSEDKKRAASVWKIQDQNNRWFFRLMMEEIDENGKEQVKFQDFTENSIYYVEDAAENYVMYIKN